MTTLAFIGDVMLGRGVNAELRRVSPESVWGTTLPVLRSADAVIANLECAITGRQAPTTVIPKVFHFRADRAAADVLRAANVRCVSLANNHSLDFGEEGLFDTLDILDEAAIAHAGAGRTLGQAAAPAIVQLPDLTVGVVGLTDNEPAFAATPRAAGTHYLDIANRPVPEKGLAELASHCRQLAGLAILSLHWGPNMITVPPAAFRAFAHAAIDAGFDMIHGHSAHLFQGVGIHRGHPILYDTGDFLDDYSVDGLLRNDWSFIFLVDVAQPVRIARVRMVPVRLNYARADLATGEESKAIRRRMIERCAALGVAAVETNGILTIECDSGDIDFPPGNLRGMIGAID